ncbi:hypothetical protein BDQ17DRAFT_1239163 [Cyathus striatus]|nr:hypothetical protein BDQ17DRAFT_1239163 [Cyathus striatus]
MYRDDGDCEPADPASTVTDRLNTLLSNSGDGYTLQLCPNQSYLIQAPILFAHPNQEISTLGYPTGGDRAMLVVNGPVENGQGHTTAVDGTCATCSGVKLRNIQIDGTRSGAPPTVGGANIEMGGQNSDQLIEYVRSFDPRGWSCLHIAEGTLNCNNATVQNNDIGPCGSDNFQEWADGISLSCRNSIVRNNMIQNPTDGGVVVFGAPGSQIYNNTIWVLNQTLLGGINMVDYDPFNGDYTGTVVRDNYILGGFANDGEEPSDTKGMNFESAIIKIGIAIGPRTWFGDRYGDNVSQNGVVTGNKLTGAFSYGIAMTSASNFTVEDNVLFGNTSFIGARGPNCSDSDTVPTPGPFILDTNSTQDLTTQSDFQLISDGNSLTCVLPPNGGDFWPFGVNPSNSSSSGTSGGGSGGGGNGGSNNGNGGSGGQNGGSGGRTAGIVVGVIVGVIAVAVGAWFLRKWAVKRKEANQHFNSTKMAEYTKYS